MRYSFLQKFSQRSFRKSASKPMLGVQRDSASHLDNRFRILNRPYHRGAVIGRLINDSNQNGSESLSIAALSASVLAMMSTGWKNENSSLEPIKGHPSPTPNTVDSTLKFDDFEGSDLDLNRLPVYSRYVFESCSDSFLFFMMY